MSNNVINIPESIKSIGAVRNFEAEFFGYPAPREYSEIEKIQIERAMRGVKNYTRLSSSLWLLEFMDIPFELVKSVEFISEYKLAITFYETQEFCIEKYFQTNFDVIKDKKFSIKYLNKDGYAVRTDSYKVVKLSTIEKEELTNEVKDITVKIILECSGHDISTCKE